MWWRRMRKGERGKRRRHDQLMELDGVNENALNDL